MAMIPTTLERLGTSLRRGAGALRRLRPAGRRRPPPGELAIVMYHSVTARAPAVWNWCQLAVAAFEEQMEYLAADRRVLALGELVDRLERGLALPDGAACITFDDALRTVLTTAYPILRRLGLPATAFVVTENPETGQPAWPDRLFHNLARTSATVVTHGGRTRGLDGAGRRADAYRAIAADLKRLDNATREARVAVLIEQLGGHRVPGDSDFAPMGWDEIEGLSADGLVDFGSHTHTHPILSRCDAVRQREELLRSRDILRDRLGRADLFAYPNGGRADFTEQTRALLRELGYRCGLSTIPGPDRAGGDRFALRRINVGADTSMRQFESMLTSG